MSREMKESGAPWMGRIPQTWRTERFKHCFNIIGGNGFAIDQQGREMGDYPFAKAGDIASSGTYLSTAANYVTDEQVKAYKYNVIPAGSILFPKIGEALKKNNRSISEVDCCIDNNCQAAIPTKCDTKFAYYLLSVMDMKWYDNSGTIPSVNNNKLKNETIPFPSEDEQKVVAQFLDTSCATIDSAISKHQQIIEKLEEYRKAVISQAVTKGLNPNAEMMGSNIPWIGRFPKAWTTPRIKDYAEFINGDRSKNYPSGDDIKSEGVPFLTSDNIHGDIVDIQRDGAKYITSEKYNTMGGAKIQINDLIYCLRGSVGLCAINKTLNEGTVASSLVVIRPENGICPEYLNYVMNSDIIHQQNDNYMNGSCAANLSAANVRNYRMTLPPVEEQKQIIEYLNRASQQVDYMVSQHNQLISRLQEYKQSLIYNAVTGKIDCRTEA